MVAKALMDGWSRRCCRAGSIRYARLHNQAGSGGIKTETDLWAGRRTPPAALYVTTDARAVLPSMCTDMSCTCAAIAVEEELAADAEPVM